MKNLKLSPLALGLTLGIVEGGAFFIFTLFVAKSGFHQKLFETLTADCFLKIEANFVGATKLLFAGAVEGFVFGFLIAAIYNFLARKF
jgi:hypothetical protein